MGRFSATRPGYVGRGVGCESSTISTPEGETVDWNIKSLDVCALRESRQHYQVNLRYTLGFTYRIYTSNRTEIILRE